MADSGEVPVAGGVVPGERMAEGEPPPPDIPFAAVSMPFASVGHATVDRERSGEAGVGDGDWTDGVAAGPVRYQKVSLLGQGGMGAVWLGHDVLLDRAVAIKVPGADDHRTRMLANEARLAARLDHPGVVAVYDVAKLDGWPCFVMAHVRGRSLRALLQSGEVVRYPVAERVRWIIEAADAVESAHQQGLVHHDLSPANVLLDEQGRVRVIDWGLAVDLRRERPPSGGGGGTPGFTAPEVLDRQVASPASDVWSLGAILCDVLAAGSLHDRTVQLATTVALDGDPLASVLVAADVPGDAEDSPMTPAQRLEQADRLDLDSRWKDLLRRCLAEDPEARPPTAGRLGDELQALIGAPSDLAAAGRPRSQRGVALLTVLGVLVLLLATAGLWRPVPSEPAAIPDRRAEAIAPTEAQGAFLLQSATAALAAGDNEGAAAAIAEALEHSGSADARRMAWELLRLPSLGFATGGAREECPNATFHPDGSTVACWTENRLELRRSGGLLWSRERSVRDVRFHHDTVIVLDESRAAQVLDPDSGDLLLADTGRGEFAGARGATRIRMDRQALLAAPGSGMPPLPVPCSEGAFAASGGGAPWLVACVEGGVWWMAPDDEPRLLEGSEATVFTAVEWVDTSTARRAVGGTRAGEVIVIEGSGLVHTIGEPVQQVLPSRWPGVVVVHGMRGRLQALDIEHGGVRAWPPNHRGRLTLLADGRLLVADDAGRWLRWPADAPLPPLSRRRLQTPHGFTSVAWDQEGQHLVALDGVGRVVAFRPHDGAVLTAARWGEGVGKGIELSPVDGSLRMTGIGDGGTRIVTISDDQVSVAPPAHPDESAARALIHFPGGEVGRLGYGNGVLVRDAGGQPLGALTMHPDGEDGERWGDVVAAAREPHGTGMWWAADTGLWRSAGMDPPELRSADTGTTALAALPEQGVATARGSILEGRDSAGEVRWQVEHEREILALAAHPHAPLLAAGDIDGWILVLQASTGEEIVRWQDHTERVAALRLSPDGEWLASASWDGTLMVHPMAPLLGWLAADRDDAWLAARLREHLQPAR